MTFQQEQQRNRTFFNPLMDRGASLDGSFQPFSEEDIMRSRINGTTRESGMPSISPNSLMPSMQTTQGDFSPYLYQELSGRQSSPVENTPQSRGARIKNSLRNFFSLNDSEDPNVWQRIKRGASAGLHSPYMDEALAGIGADYQYQVNNRIDQHNQRIENRFNEDAAETLEDRIAKDKNLSEADRELIRISIGPGNKDVAQGAKMYQSYRDAIERRNAAIADRAIAAKKEQEEAAYRKLKRRYELIGERNKAYESQSMEEEGAVEQKDRDIAEIYSGTGGGSRKFKPASLKPAKKSWLPNFGR